ncbi:MAG: hypothetical protein OXT67_03345 [Zetaproteobacteria bacterium]|nr:hypothetical protein [Zetaproteobacteria bacterium]
MQALFLIFLALTELTFSSTLMARAEKPHHVVFIEARQNTITKLEALKAQLENKDRGCQIAQVTGSSLSAVGGIVCCGTLVAATGGTAAIGLAAGAVASGIGSIVKGGSYLAGLQVNKQILQSLEEALEADEMAAIEYEAKGNKKLVESISVGITAVHTAQAGSELLHAYNGMPTLNQGSAQVGDYLSKAMGHTSEAFQSGMLHSLGQGFHMIMEFGGPAMTTIGTAYSIKTLIHEAKKLHKNDPSQLALELNQVLKTLEKKLDKFKEIAIQTWGELPREKRTRLEVMQDIRQQKTQIRRAIIRDEAEFKKLYHSLGNENLEPAVRDQLRASAQEALNMNLALLHAAHGQLIDQEIEINLSTKYYF